MYLGSRYAQEADRHEHPSDSHLVVAEFDPVEVLDTQAVRRDQTVQRKDLVHLDSGHQGTTALPNDMGD